MAEEVELAPISETPPPAPMLERPAKTETPMEENRLALTDYTISAKEF